MIKIRTIFYPLLLMMVWGPPSFRIEQLDTALNNPTSATDLSTVYRIATWGIAAIILGYYLFRHFIYRGRVLPSPLTRGALGLYGGFASVAVLSTIYSLRPAYTLFFAGKLLVSWLALGLYTNISDTQLTKSKDFVLLRTLYMVMIGQWSLIIILYFIRPELVGNNTTGIGYRLTGGIFNDFGFSAAISGIFFLTQVIFHRSLLVRGAYATLYLLSWAFVLLSQTRTTMVIALLCAFLMIGLQRKLSVKFWFVWGIVVAGLLSLTIGAYQFVVRFVMRGQTVEAFRNLTGRASAFEFLIAQWRNSPFWGFGYEAGHRVIMSGFSEITGGHLAIAHDVVSRVLIDLGLMGGVLLFLTAGVASIELFKLWKTTYHNRELLPTTLQLIALMNLALLSGISGSAFAGLSWPFLIVLAVTPQVRRLAVIVKKQDFIIAPHPKDTSLALIEP